MAWNSTSEATNLCRSIIVIVIRQLKKPRVKSHELFQQQQDKLTLKSYASEVTKANINLAKFVLDPYSDVIASFKVFLVASV